MIGFLIELFLSYLVRALSLNNISTQQMVDPGRTMSFLIVSYAHLDITAEIMLNETCASELCLETAHSCCRVLEYQN